MREEGLSVSRGPGCRGALSALVVRDVGLLWAQLDGAVLPGDRPALTLGDASVPEVLGKALPGPRREQWLLGEGRGLAAPVEGWGCPCRDSGCF